MNGRLAFSQTPTNNLEELSAHAQIKRFIAPKLWQQTQQIKQNIFPVTGHFEVKLATYTLKAYFCRFCKEFDFIKAVSGGMYTISNLGIEKIDPLLRHESRIFKHHTEILITINAIFVHFLIQWNFVEYNERPILQIQWNFVEYNECPILHYKHLQICISQRSNDLRSIYFTWFGRHQTPDAFCVHFLRQQTFRLDTYLQVTGFFLHQLPVL